MKPFTFMTVVLGLILGFYFAAGRATYVEYAAGPRHDHRPRFLRPHAPTAPPPILRPPDPPEPPVPHEVVLVDDEDADDREEAEGLPVRIVPGTAVTEAEIQPPRTPPSRRKPAPPRQRPKRPEAVGERGRVYRPGITETAPPATVRAISGRLSATSDRARADARLQLVREVTEWLTPEVPAGWKPPDRLVGDMVRQIDVRPIEKDYGTVYEATFEADFSPNHRHRILAAYHHEVVSRRLVVLGGSLGFVLVCLASLAGYIRADEATKGYYTRWLRIAATASVGAAGAAVYHVLT